MKPLRLLCSIVLSTTVIIAQPLSKDQDALRTQIESDASEKNRNIGLQMTRGPGEVLASLLEKSRDTKSLDPSAVVTPQNGSPESSDSSEFSLQYGMNSTLSAKDALDLTKKDLEHECDEWLSGTHVYKNRSNMDEALLKQKEGYRNNLCAIDPREKSPYMRHIDKEINRYEPFLTSLLNREGTLKDSGLILYHGMYTQASNLYEFANAVRRVLKPSTKDAIVKIFLKKFDATEQKKDPSSFWGMVLDGKKSTRDIVDNFLDFVVEKNQYDGYPVNLSLLSFATSVTSSAVGESPLYFLLTDPIIKEQKGGLGIVFRVIDGVLKTIGYTAEETATFINELKTTINFEKMDGIDNRRILQILFNRQDVKEWGPIGYWSMSHGTAVATDSYFIYDLGALYKEILNFRIKGGFDKSSFKSFTPLAGSDSDELVGSKSGSFNMDESKDGDLGHQESLGFFDDSRSSTTSITTPEGIKAIPVAHRLQARIAFNLPKASAYMENKAQYFDQNFALSSDDDRIKLKDAINTIANRFMKKIVKDGKMDKLVTEYPYFELN